MSKIAIDARMYRESGVGRYIRNLLAELAKIDTRNQYYVLLLKKDFEVVELPENFVKVEADFRWYGVAEQRRLPGILNKLKVDLVHFPHFNVPIFYRGKFIVTVHDLIHQKVQMRRATTRDPFTYWIKQSGYKKVLNSALKRSLKVLTVSDFVAQELIEIWKVEPQKVVVTKEAVDETILELAENLTRPKQQKVLTKYGIRENYLFYIGNAHPHKNVERLISAFLKLQHQFPDLKLVLAGHDHYFWQRIKSENRYPGIIYPGFISDEEMVALYKNAKAFVMPSLEEGFGIPLLEAFACDCPVVSSNAASLPEVGGKAAVYFDPRNEIEMIEKISLVLKDQRLRRELITAGQSRYKLFSWKKLATETLAIYANSLQSL